jgi:hypothetical protein
MGKGKFAPGSKARHPGSAGGHHGFDALPVDFVTVIGDVHTRLDALHYHGLNAAPAGGRDGEIAALRTELREMRERVASYKVPRRLLTGGRISHSELM